MDGFARMNAGTTSPAEFFAPEKTAAIVSAAAARVAGARSLTTEGATSAPH